MRVRDHSTFLCEASIGLISKRDSHSTRVPREKEKNDRRSRIDSRAATRARALSFLRNDAINREDSEIILVCDSIERKKKKKKNSFVQMSRNDSARLVYSREIGSKVIQEDFWSLNITTETITKSTVR